MSPFANKRGTPQLVATADGNAEDDDDETEPKRLVLYFNFEKILKHNRIEDKSGYENSGTMQPGGEILKFSDKDYTCNQAARLWGSDITLRGDMFQAKPKHAITIAAWIKLEQKPGSHSVFDTIGSTHNKGQYHFEVNDGVVRWFHRNQCQQVVFETMAHSAPGVLTAKWAHIAGTYDSKTRQAKVFINAEIRNQSIGDGPLSPDWGVRAAVGQHETHRPLRGTVDEFRIYNYALKKDEIKSLVTACKSGGGVEGGASTGKAVSDGATSDGATEKTEGTKRELLPTTDSSESNETKENAEEKETTKRTLPSTEHKGLKRLLKL